MPLHLLGKKSWNVYNADNIARVRRDEAAAKAAEEEEEQRMQEIDAQLRLAILRGETPPPIEDAEPSRSDEPPARGALHPGSMRRKRKRPDEDDTDFEMRIAKESDNMAITKLEPARKSTSSAPIVDHAGHIDLLGDEKVRAHAEKNEEAEREAKKKKQSYEDQYTMRLVNAPGKDGILRPWYSQSDAAAPDASSKDVWGNQDPKRKERDARRTVSNDPLSMMKNDRCAATTDIATDEDGGTKRGTEVETETGIGVGRGIRKDLRDVMNKDEDQESDMTMTVMGICIGGDMIAHREKNRGMMGGNGMTDLT
ncbi:hypothetical protein FZEAL_6873 [Fusarium zealandicum]|uniref:CBF1-interacting co-repressor CIR N-terminal domain-containing protein n=1 Tax=Fusarium zealandicum TaxID=1053134 RepID=A0A8H4XIE2_9HYPO|nr:hypothetical protein FZEAL_6873 [Fusarium zealandicum]